MNVSTYDDGSLVVVRNERVWVELSRNDESPGYPVSWTWGIWFDGSQIDGSCDEMSFDDSVTNAYESIVRMARELVDTDLASALTKPDRETGCLAAVGFSDDMHVDETPEQLRDEVEKLRSDNTKLMRLYRGYRHCLYDGTCINCPLRSTEMECVSDMLEEEIGFRYEAEE